ncbi:MAG TPA: aminotransferase class IV [Gaiellaceae bacterium]|nr:aminotransferase class IV [Gaiellaceae bacterium]
MSLLAVHRLGAGALPLDAPAVHADDEGFLRGRAVFETLRVYGGTPFRLDAHLERLARSALLVGLPEPDLAGLARLGLDAVAAAGEPDAVLRFLWTPGREGGGGPTGLALVSALPPGLDELRAHGLRLAVVGWAPGHRLAATKSTSYAENLAAQQEARGRGADDALLVDLDGTVLEAPTANVWFREGTRLLTPSLGQPILAGVTRAALWELAGAAGFEPEEGVFALERVTAADEVFLSSSVREVMPVVVLDGTSVGDGRPGEAARELQRRLRTLAEGRYPPGDG